MGRQPNAPNLQGVLGGDPNLNALLFEAIDRVASPHARRSIIERAMAEAGTDALPEDIAQLLQFVCGPLRSVATGTLGEEAAGALVSDVQPLLERVQKIRSSIPPVSDAPAASVPPSDSTVESKPTWRISTTRKTRRALSGEHVRTVAPTLPPARLYRDDDGPASTKPAAPDPPRKRGTLPYVEAVTTSRRHVLLVDDDVVFLRGLSRLMRATGLEILTAPDGGSALRICARLCPALVITDLDMPAPNGFDLAAALADRHGDSAPPVVVLTGSADHPTEWPGVAKILTKMIRPDDLLAEIQPYLPSDDDTS